MPKTHRINFSGGINTIADKVVQPQGGYCTVIDNGHVRSGSVRSFRAPMQTTFVADDSTRKQLFEYRGKFYFSTLRRSYATEYVGRSERIYFSEYPNWTGTSVSDTGYPQKIVDGVQVNLGTPVPVTAPGVSRSTSLTATGITLTELASSGAYMKDRRVSYRIALETEDGIQTPSSKLVAVASANNVAFKITWGALASGVKCKNILIFGVTEDKEQLIATIAGSETTYTDTGSVSSAGALASTYEQELTWQYVYTFSRSVNGVFDESGPSPLSRPLASSDARAIGISATTDGFWSSKNLVQFASGTWGAATLTKSADLGATKAITAMAVDATDGRVKVTSTAHEFMDGEKVLFVGFSDTAYNLSVRTVRHLDPPDANAYYLDATVAPTDVSYSGRTAQRIVSINVGAPTATHAYVPYYSGVLFTLATGDQHTLTSGDKVTASGWTDVAWEGKTFEVVVPNGSQSTFYVRGMANPTGTVGTFKVALSKLSFASVPAGTSGVYKGDCVDLTLKDNSAPTVGVVSGLFEARPIATASGVAFMFMGFSSWTGTVQASSLSARWIPHNDYIQARSLYRIGDTGEYLKVKDLKLWETSYVDGKSTDKLGSAITSFYNENGIDLVAEPPPLLDALMTHYGMLFGLDDHTLRWTPPGRPDFWSSVCSMPFPYRPVALESFDQALIVLCMDALYRVDGTSATTLTRSKTLAEDGCIAPYGVQKTGAGLVYPAKRGLMLFNGKEAVCISDGKIPSRMLHGSSGSAGAAFWWLPTQWTKHYQDLSVEDGLGADPYAPANIVGTEPASGVNTAMRSFYHQGRYFLYWSDAESGYKAHGMLCVDMQDRGFPITTLGFKPIDVHVSDNDEAYCLLDYSPPDFSLTITVS